MSNLFVRKATGMVRSWSVFDAFIYAFFSINIVTLGFYSFSQMYFFGGGMINSLILSAVFLIFEIIVYASLISVMPRSGGDYVWMTRIFGGGIGFILAITGWWFTLWLWTPIYGDMLRQFVLTPLLGVLGQKDLALWFSGKGREFSLISRRSRGEHTKMGKEATGAREPVLRAILPGPGSL